jgi:hypothetical protein
VIGQDSEQVATDFITHAVNFLYKSKAEVEANDSLSEPVKDQGLTSCRVLILVPRKAEAIRVIETLIRLHCKGKRKRINKKTKQKYTEEFLEADPVSAIIERGLLQTRPHSGSTEASADLRPFQVLRHRPCLSSWSAQCLARTGGRTA